MKLFLLLILFLSLLAISCAPKGAELTILTENYPPLSYIEDGEVTGYGADVVAAIQKKLRTDVKPLLIDWDRAYERALNEENIVLFTMEKTPEREELFYFIGPLGKNSAFLYARADAQIQINELEEAKKVSAIATTRNWFTEQYLMERGFTNLLREADPINTLHMLMNRSAELGVFTDVTFPELVRAAGYRLEELRPVFEMMSSEYYIAISKSTDQKIVEKWEKAFAALQKDGTIDGIFGKWFRSRH